MQAVRLGVHPVGQQQPDARLNVLEVLPGLLPVGDDVATVEHTIGQVVSLGGPDPERDETGAQSTRGKESVQPGGGPDATEDASVEPVVAGVVMAVPDVVELARVAGIVPVTRGEVPGVVAELGCTRTHEVAARVRGGCSRRGWERRAGRAV